MIGAIGCRFCLRFICDAGRPSKRAMIQGASAILLATLTPLCPAISLRFAAIGLDTALRYQQQRSSASSRRLHAALTVTRKAMIR